jgi:hypothetical protein
MDIFSGTNAHVNLLTFYENHPAVHSRFIGQHFSLDEGVQEPGNFGIELVVSADNVPSTREKFRFEWKDFEHMSLSEISQSEKVND